MRMGCFLEPARQKFAKAKPVVDGFSRSLFGRAAS